MSSDKPIPIKYLEGKWISFLYFGLGKRSTSKKTNSFGGKERRQLRKLNRHWFGKDENPSNVKFADEKGSDAARPFI